MVFNYSNIVNSVREWRPNASTVIKLKIKRLNLEPLLPYTCALLSQATFSLYKSTSTKKELENYE